MIIDPAGKGNELKTRLEKQHRPDAAVISQMKQIEDQADYQLDDSTARSLRSADSSLVLYHSLINYFRIGIIPQNFK